MRAKFGVAGTNVLAVTIRGLRLPEPTDTLVSGAITPSAPGVAGLHLDPVFEGQAMLYIGLDAQRPYAVTTLTDPVRVVVDIADS